MYEADPESIKNRLSRTSKEKKHPPKKKVNEP